MNDELRLRAFFAVRNGSPDWELIRDLWAALERERQRADELARATNAVARTDEVPEPTLRGSSSS